MWHLTTNVSIVSQPQLYIALLSRDAPPTIGVQRDVRVFFDHYQLHTEQRWGVVERFLGMRFLSYGIFPLFGDP